MLRESIRSFFLSLFAKQMFSEDLLRARLCVVGTGYSWVNKRRIIAVMVITVKWGETDSKKK